jgi:hypothetical protein
MRVKDLLKCLKSLPEDAQVVVSAWDRDGRPYWQKLDEGGVVMKTLPKLDFAGETVDYDEPADLQNGELFLKLGY